MIEKCCEVCDRATRLFTEVYDTETHRTYKVCEYIIHRRGSEYLDVDNSTSLCWRLQQATIDGKKSIPG